MDQVPAIKFVGLLRFMSNPATDYPRLAIFPLNETGGALDHEVAIEVLWIAVGYALVILPARGAIPTLTTDLSQYRWHHPVARVRGAIILVSRQSPQGSQFTEKANDHAFASYCSRH
jgi:hypothetical protein